MDAETCKCLIIFRTCEGMEKYMVSTTIGASYLKENLAVSIKIKHAYTN